MTPGEARVGARVTWADEFDVGDRGEILTVETDGVTVRWDETEPGYNEFCALDELRLLPDEAQQ